MTDTIIKLKDGTEVQDVRLDRLVQFDERSRSYPIRIALPTKTLRTYSWRCKIALDQGREGSCVGHGVAHTLAARPREKTVDSTLAVKIYHHAQRLDPWVGGSYEGAAPRYEGTSVLAGVQAAKELGFISEYRWCFSLQDVLMTLAYVSPVVLGLNWYEGMGSPDERGYIHATGELQGGHCLLARGVNVREKTVLLRNSWGSDWSVLGADCRISFDDLGKLLREQGEAVVVKDVPL